MKKRSVFLGISLCAMTQFAYAASEEIAVYLDDKEPAGKLSVDLHNNWVASGSNDIPYIGGQPPVKMYRLTPEFNYGLSETYELGVYYLSDYQQHYGTSFDGMKVRLKYIAPHDSANGFFWGVNTEFGRLNKTTAEYPWNGEIKGIAGWRQGKLTVGANLNLDKSLTRKADPLTIDTDFKVMYEAFDKTQFGIESYNEWGPVQKLSPIGGESKTVYAVIDTNVLGHDVNFGVGHGLNNNSDGVILKAIVNFKLN